MTEREFVDWVHIHVGHGGYDDLEDLVELDDEYDPVDFPEADQWFGSPPRRRRSANASVNMRVASSRNEVPPTQGTSPLGTIQRADSPLGSAAS